MAVHNRTGSRTRELVDRHGGDGELVGTFSVEEFVAALARPRRVLVMVKAGPAVDAVLEELAGHLEDAYTRAAQAVDLARQYQQRGNQAWALWLLG